MAKIIVVIDTVEGKETLVYPGEKALMEAVIHDYIQGKATGSYERPGWYITGPQTSFSIGSTLTDAQKAALAAGRAKRDAGRAARKGLTTDEAISTFSPIASTDIDLSDEVPFTEGEFDRRETS